MTQRKRVDLSAAQRTDIGGRWKAGESLHEIGRAFGLSHTSIQTTKTENASLALL